MSTYATTRLLAMLLLVILLSGCALRKKPEPLPRPWNTIFPPEKGVVA